MTFASQAQSPAVELDSLLLAVAHEHGPVDFIAAWAELDRLAAALRGHRARGDRLDEQAEALVDLFRREGFRAARAVSPEDALLDAVLRRREGHPLLIASICAAVAGRAGLRAAPIRSAEDALVGITDGERALAIDPTGRCDSAPGRAHWLCPHEVAFFVLDELSGLLALHGRVEEAIHAGRLRLELPVSVQVRERVEFEARALRARLN